MDNLFNCTVVVKPFKKQSIFEPGVENLVTQYVENSWNELKLQFSPYYCWATKKLGFS